jgi:hypothetical protein
MYISYGSHTQEIARQWGIEIEAREEAKEPAPA